MNTSYVFLADGFEEVEALTVVDVMRRAGMEVSTVSIADKLNVKGAHGVEVMADKLIAETDTTDAEWLIVPGGNARGHQSGRMRRVKRRFAEALAPEAGAR